MWVEPVAPNVDLTQISAKRVRKSMLAADKNLDPRWVKAHQESIDKLITQVFNTVAQSAQITLDLDSSSANVSGKRKHEELESDGLVLPSSQQPISSKHSHPAFINSAKQKSEQELADEEFARQLSAEINTGRTTRGSTSSTGAHRPFGTGKPKHGRHGLKGTKIKSPAKVADSDGEDDDENHGSGEDFGPGKKKRKKRENGGGGARGGFAKAFALSEPLAELTGHITLSRPQVVKAIWEHIKANDLQDPRDKRDIICDDKVNCLSKDNRDKLSITISDESCIPERENQHVQNEQGDWVVRIPRTQLTACRNAFSRHLFEAS